MSTRGAYELEDGTLVRTQGEIPKGQPVKKIGVPVGHQELIDFINGIIARERAQSPQLVDKPVVVEQQPEEAPTPPPPPVPSPAAPKTDEAETRRKLALALRGMEAEAIEKRIIEAKPAEFARYCVASIERFGVLGREAWLSVKGFLDVHSAQVSAYDRGLHLLALSQIASLGEEKTAPKTYKELQG